MGIFSNPVPAPGGTSNETIGLLRPGGSWRHAQREALWKLRGFPKIRTWTTWTSDIILHRQVLHILHHETWQLCHQLGLPASCGLVGLATLVGGCSVALAGPVGSQPGHRIMSWPDSSYTTQLGCNSCNAPPLRLVPLLRFNVFQHSKSKPRHLVVCRKQVVTCCDCKHPNCTNHPKVW